jgi:hypothetical protein
VIEELSEESDEDDEMEEDDIDDESYTHNEGEESSHKSDAENQSDTSSVGLNRQRGRKKKATVKAEQKEKKKVRKPSLKRESLKRESASSKKESKALVVKKEGRLAMIPKKEESKMTFIDIIEDTKSGVPAKSELESREKKAFLKKSSENKAEGSLKAKSHLAS